MAGLKARPSMPRPSSPARRSYILDGGRSGSHGQRFSDRGLFPGRPSKSRYVGRTHPRPREAHGTKAVPWLPGKSHGTKPVPWVRLLRGSAYARRASVEGRAFRPAADDADRTGAVGTTPARKRVREKSERGRAGLQARRRRRGSNRCRGYDSCAEARTREERAWKGGPSGPPQTTRIEPVPWVRLLRGSAYARRASVEGRAFRPAADDADRTGAVGTTPARKRVREKSERGRAGLQARRRRRGSNRCRGYDSCAEARTREERAWKGGPSGPPQTTRIEPVPWVRLLRGSAYAR